jgi:hypothetical protein
LVTHSPGKWEEWRRHAAARGIEDRDDIFEELIRLLAVG